MIKYDVEFDMNLDLMDEWNDSLCFINFLNCNFVKVCDLIICKSWWFLSCEMRNVELKWFSLCMWFRGCVQVY